MEKHYLKLSNHNIFAPKMIPRPSSFNLKCRKLLNYYPKSSKFSNRTPELKYFVHPTAILNF